MYLFSEKDFSCFATDKVKSSEHNNERLIIRRKLQKIGKDLSPLLEEKGCQLNIKTSLHHPFVHNQYHVSSQWVYFAPSPQNIKDIKKIFGSSFFEELKSGYNHTLLLIGIDRTGIFISLKTHARAWWDGQNLKNKCSTSDMRTKFKDLLNELGSSFQLKIHDFKKIYPCGSINTDEMNMFFKYYSPGEHWLHLDTQISQRDSFVEEEILLKKIHKLLLSLTPIYQFIKWSPQNDYVFKKKNA